MTPAPTPPQPRAVPALLQIIGPLIGGFAGDNGSLRRFILGVAGIVAVAGNHRFGLELTTVELGILSGMVATIILGSNVKEVQKAKADAQVSIAETNAAVAANVAAVVTAPPEAG